MAYKDSLTHYNYFGTHIHHNYSTLLLPSCPLERESSDRKTVEMNTIITNDE